jgi:hypothetical protein
MAEPSGFKLPDRWSNALYICQSRELKHTLINSGNPELLYARAWSLKTAFCHDAQSDLAAITFTGNVALKEF